MLSSDPSPSRQPEMASVPSGENATGVTLSPCPLNDATRWPDSASQIIAIRVDTVARRVPSGENATSRVPPDQPQHPAVPCVDDLDVVCRADGEQCTVGGERDPVVRTE